MDNQEKLKKYTNSFIDALAIYLKKGFQVSATIHPASGEGAVIEVEIHEGKRSGITIVSTVPKVNNTLEKIDQRIIGGNIRGGCQLIYIAAEKRVYIVGSFSILNKFSKITLNQFKLLQTQTV